MHRAFSIQDYWCATHKMWYSDLFANPLGRCQPSRENSKADYTAGNCNGRVFITLMILTGLLDVDRSFLSPTNGGLRGHPYKVLQGKTNRRKRGLAFSVRGAKYWNKLPAFVFPPPSVNILKEGRNKCGRRPFPISHFWLNTHLPHFLTPTH